MYTCDEACYDYNNGHVCCHIHHIHSTQHGTQDTMSNDILTQAIPQAADTHGENATEMSITMSDGMNTLYSNLYM